MVTSTLFISVEMMSFSVMLCLLSVFYFRKQLLVVLLSMEFVLLSLFVLVVLVYSSFGQSVSTSFYILILGACEASLGLSLLVVMTRIKGMDMLSLLSLMKF
uniref:NADH-ubiquinone oxidoreductase chain 4L n=1 Tax=Flustra foliacea TaxID=478208 RepID=H2ESU3_9BILA|nr:NADH dehydrogenase subunit 4L [Flustra foliacea]AEX16061.1 NADH dehydrogenase subunit 4L [Flustra foliacea]